MKKFENAKGRQVLLAMVRAIQTNKQYLGEIDGAVADGDHGMNMNKGFTLYAESLGEKEVTFSDGVFDLGNVLLNKIGGSMGPIYGTIFIAISEKLEDLESIGLDDLTDALDFAREELYEIIGARPGDKTLVDTFIPAIDSLKVSQSKNETFEHALVEMKNAANAGKDSTFDMVAKFGRSSRLGERSRGVLDAGATSCAILLESMADGMLQVMEG